MGRHNHKKQHRSMADRYDTDYISLPEYPHILRINAVPMKTVYINVDADFEPAETYTAKSWSDPVLQAIVRNT